MILVISQQTDSPTIELVTKKLSQSGEDFFVLNAPDLHRGKASLTANGHGLTLRVNDRKFVLDDIKSVWVRRPFGITDERKTSTPVLDKHVQSELKTLTEGLIELFIVRNTFVLNNPHVYAHISNKIIQWDAFLKLGIPIPETLVSNFVSAITPDKTVVKQLSTKSFMLNGSPHVLPTKVLHEKELTALEKSDLPPLLLQDVIDISYEVRVTVVGQQLFAARIDYDSSETTDYRLLFSEKSKLRYDTYELPQESAQHCLNIMEHFGLHFGCIDIAVDRQGKHWIIEINPNGQWGWIEVETGLPISRAIAEMLANPPESSRALD